MGLGLEGAVSTGPYDAKQTEVAYRVTYNININDS